MNYVIGIAIGCVVTIVVYLLLSKSKTDPGEKLAKIIAENTQLKRKSHELETNLRREVCENREKITAIELRQDQADQWFGSIIRHSQAQFKKEAVEAFLDEHGLKEEEDE